jgi:DNA-binding transcriptional ArsR family regulator
LLTDQRPLRCLAPFLCGEQTLSSASAAAGVPPSTMAYWLPRFRDAGLVEVAARRKRAGMASTSYRPAADVFLVDATLAGQARIEALVNSGGAAFSESVGAMRTMGRLDTLQLAVSGRTATAVDVRFARPASGQHAVVRQWIEPMRLSKAQAQALWDDLITVIERYKAADGHGTEYVLQFTIAPDDPRHAV